MKDFLLILIATIILIIAINNLNHSNIKKQNSISGIDKTYISEPIQTKSSGEKEKMNINGINLEIEKVYSYEITGQVVKTYEYKEYYTGNKTYNTIASKDVGIVWGDLVKEENQEKINFEMRGGRFLRWQINDRNWLSKIGGLSSIGNLISNNHLITNDEKILSLIGEIEEGDFIRIKGYLVNVYGDKFKLMTSTSRNDTMDGACEVILVEDIKWIN